MWWEILNRADVLCSIWKPNKFMKFWILNIMLFGMNLSKILHTELKKLLRIRFFTWFGDSWDYILFTFAEDMRYLYRYDIDLTEMSDCLLRHTFHVAWTELYDFSNLDDVFDWTGILSIFSWKKHNCLYNYNKT